jgi:Patatin-like phospholipase
MALAVIAFVLAFLWKSPVERLSWRKAAPWLSMVTVLLAIVLLAHVDKRENDYLRDLFANPTTSLLSELRFYSQAKFLLFGGAALGVLLTLGIGVRREFRFWTQKTPATISEPHKFALLFESEQKAILEARKDNKIASTEITVEAADEPRASRCNVNFFGLALSGGGIRSATFNLGLLQGLHRYDLLRHVDYLTTVSGGGYIGGFWSRWLKESASERAQKGLFPDRLKEAMKNFSGDSRTFETHEIRHVREFSNFLFPRVGIFDTETWGGAVALIAAILPAVATALSVLGLSLIAWLALTFYMACPDMIEFGWVSA